MGLKHCADSRAITSEFSSFLLHSFSKFQVWDRRGEEVSQLPTCLPRQFRGWLGTEHCARKKRERKENLSFNTDDADLQNVTGCHVLPASRRMWWDNKSGGGKMIPFSRQLVNPSSPRSATRSPLFFCTRRHHPHSLTHSSASRDCQWTRAEALGQAGNRDWLSAADWGVRLVWFRLDAAGLQNQWRMTRDEI